MTAPLTIVMYHYVRPLARSRFPRIKGLDVTLFDEQIEFLRRNYSIVSMDAVLDALDGVGELPARPALLTFDDGYADHYSHVLPRLVDRSLTAAFFPPASAVMDHRVLDVNKIHFVLASPVPIEQLVAKIENACRTRSEEFDLKGVAEYRTEHWMPNEFDPAPVNFVKRMLQVALPQRLRAELTARLFSEVVSSDEAAFAEELYASVEQLKLMVALGMHVGSHSETHPWLSHLSRVEQEREILGSLRLLSAVGMPDARRTLCYPYGEFDAHTIDILKDNGFSAAVTTRTAVAKVAPSERYLLPRLDTNHLPKDRHAASRP